MRAPERSEQRTGLRPAARLFGAATLSGCLLAAATHQVGVGLLAFIATVPLVAAIDSLASGRRGGALSPALAALAGWVSGLIFFGAGFAWLPVRGYPAALPAVVLGYVGWLSLSLAAFAGALAWLRARDRSLSLAAAPALWVVLEYLRSQGWLGYPWQQLGYALSAYPELIQLAAYGGVYGLSLWVASVSSALVWARNARPAAALGVAVLAASPLLLAPRATLRGESEPGLRVAAVQPALYEPGRREPDVFRRNLARLLDLTARAAEAGADVIAWPESAFERPVPPGGDLLLGSISQQYATPLLTGAWRVEPGAQPALYNSAVLVHPHGDVEVAGDKVHPVPVYESTPRSEIERALARLVRWPGHFRPGERSGLVRLTDSPPIDVGILICLDSSYPELARDLRRRGADLLLELSNESLTGVQSAVQHAHVSRLRAVETGLPLVRVANIGPTEWTDGRGRVIARLVPGAPGAAAVAVPPAMPLTPYTRTGDTPVLALALLPPLALAAWRLRRRKWAGSAGPTQNSHRQETRTCGTR